jgi:hypothetical protein
MAEVTSGDYERGLKLLGTAKRVTALVRKMDAADSEDLREAVDRLTERGLALVMQGARAMAQELAAARAAFKEP